MIGLVEDYSRNISVKLIKISAVIASKAYFHFSHNKPMETLSCHRNDST